MHLKLVLCSHLLIILSSVRCKNNDPDYKADTKKLILSRGFQYQEHDIVTEDGYILKTFRIVNPYFKSSGRPVILMHGLFASSRDFLIASPGGNIDEDTGRVGNNLGFELAKRGYDVWLPNNRGNVYSQDHVRFRRKSRGHSNTDIRFWNHAGWTDMIKYDVPAIVEYVRSETYSKTVAWIGHSRGTTIMFGALSLFPDLNPVVRPFIALAPVTRIRHASRILKFFAKSSLLPTLLGGPFNGPILFQTPTLRMIERMICSMDGGRTCADLFSMGGGDGHEMFDASRMHVFFSGLPAGISTLDLKLFGQNIETGKFAEFDRESRSGFFSHRARYPIEYKLRSITNNDIYLISGASDTLAHPLDTEQLEETLSGKIKESIVIPVKRWGHMAMIMGKETGKYVNTPIIRILNSYQWLI